MAAKKKRAPNDAPRKAANPKPPKPAPAPTPATTTVDRDRSPR